MGFFVNVPIGILAFTGIYLLLDKIKSIEKRPFDWKGFILIAIFLSCLQIALDRGEQLDWFDSLEIRVEFAISILFCFQEFLIRLSINSKIFWCGITK
jgi:DHA2 family multidrug resistance protein